MTCSTRRRTRLSRALGCAVALAIVACSGGGSGASSKLQSISVTPATATIPAGGTRQFSATARFSDGSTAPLEAGVTWTSSQPSVATVTGAGLATGVATATATTLITATKDGVSGTATLTVTPANATVQAITIAPAAISVGVGLTAPLTATAHFADGSSAEMGDGLTWSSSATSVATVSAAGMVTGAAPGQALVTATHGPSGVTGTATVSVAAVESLTIAPPTASVPAGLTRAFGATAHLSSGASVDVTSGIAWSSSDGAIATVDASGVATGVASGTADIVATHAAAGVSGRAVLTVEPPAVQGIVLSPSSPSVAAGLSLQLSATAQLSNATSADLTSSVRFESSSPSVALVNGAGLVFALAPGEARITATHLATGLSDTVTITVTDAVLKAITVAPSPANLPAGFTRTLVATGHFSDGTAAALASGVTWATSAPATALTFPDGNVSGEAAGAATVTATHVASGLSATAPVTVTDATLLWLSFDADAFLYQHYEAPITVVGHFSDGSAMPIPAASLSFASSDPAVASVTAAGVVIGEAGGRTLVSAVHGTTRIETGEWFYVTPTYDVAFPVGVPAAATTGKEGALYRVNGVTPGAWYSVKLSSPSADVQLSAYPELQGEGGCFSWSSGTADEACDLQATGTTLFLEIYGGFAPTGATFTLEVAPAAPPAYPGLTPAAPVAGAVADADTTYALTGLTPGQYYVVTLDGLSGDADLYVYGDAALSQYLCGSTFASIIPDACAAVAPASGTLYVQVSPLEPTPFTLTARLIAPPAPVGTSDLPLATHVDGYAVFALGGLTEGELYDVTLDGLGADADLHVFADAALTQELCDSTNAGTDPESCFVQAPGARLFVALDATLAPSGTDAVLGVAAVPPPALDGTLVFGLDFPASGAAAADPLRYRIAGLIPGASYGVTLSGLGADLDLAVYDGERFEWQVCSSREVGTAAENCLATADAAGELFVAVEPYDTTGGAFSLNVLPQALPVTVGLDATLDLPLSRFVSETVSYDLTGLVPGESYRVQIDDLTDDVDLAVYADASGTDLLCHSSWDSDTYAERCAFTAPASGSALVVLAPMDGGAGSAVRLELSPYVIPDLSGTVASLPDSGTVVAGSVERYEVTGLSPLTLYTFSLTSLTDDVDLAVYFDRAFTQRYDASAQYGTVDESCLGMANEAGVAYVELDGSWAGADAAFTLSAVPAP